jgi:4-hydroxy-tetrahydrodipicolinate synthase
MWNSGANDRLRMPRKPPSGERGEAIEKIVKDAIATRPELPRI